MFSTLFKAVKQILHRHCGSLLTRDIKDNASAVHHERAVTEFQGLVHVVRDHEATDIPIPHDARGQREHLCRGLRIQSRRVLIEQKELRCHNRGH